MGGWAYDSVCVYMVGGMMVVLVYGGVDELWNGWFVLQTGVMGDWSIGNADGGRRSWLCGCVDGVMGWWMGGWAV